MKTAVEFKPVAVRDLRIPNTIPEKIVERGTAGLLVRVSDDERYGPTVFVRWPRHRKPVGYWGAGLDLIGWPT